MMERNRRQGGGSWEIVLEEIEGIEKKIQHLLNLVESGGSAGEAVRIRLAELEGEKALLKSRVEALELPLEPDWAGEQSHLVKAFMDRFGWHFEHAPIEERKALIKKCISSIVVDRDASMVRFFVRTIPAVTPQLEEILLKVEGDPHVMSTESARNTTHRVLHPLEMCLASPKKPRDEVIFIQVYVLAQFNQHS